MSRFSPGEDLYDWLTWREDKTIAPNTSPFERVKRTRLFLAKPINNHEPDDSLEIIVNKPSELVKYYPHPVIAFEKDYIIISRYSGNIILLCQVEKVKPYHEYYTNLKRLEREYKRVVSEEDPKYEKEDQKYDTISNNDISK